MSHGCGWKRIAARGALMGAACLALAAPARAQLDPVPDFGENPAQLLMHVHVPAALPDGPRPLVVALHGCTQDPATFAGAGWNDLADEWGFLVVYPEQNREVNNSLGCFNWGGSWPGTPNAFVASSTPLNTEDLERGRSENESIVQMVDYMKAHYAVDGNRVFVAGLSAGGGMAAVMLATWPDVFAGGVIYAGIPYACATDRANSGEASACLSDMTGTNAYLDRTPAEWGDLVRRVFPGYDGPYPRVSIWHGTLDFTVKPKASVELMEQWTNVSGAEPTPTATESMGDAERNVYATPDGTPVVETWTITGMGHGAPIDSASGCGSLGSYVTDVGICAARLAGEFLGLDGSGPDRPDPEDPGPSGDPDGPTVTITAPATGDLVDGTVTVAVEADDPDGVSRVELYVDDALAGEVSSPPFAFEWDTTVDPDGAHRLRAQAYDPTDAMGVDEAQVIVSNGGGGSTGGGSTGGGSTGGGSTGGVDDPAGADGSFVAGCRASGPGGALPAPLAPLAVLALLLWRRRGGGQK